MKLKNNKLCWYIILFITIVLFISSLFFRNYLINGLVIVMSIIIYKYGNPVIFKEYDNKNKKRIEESVVVREAVKKTLASKKFFNSK